MALTVSSFTKSMRLPTNYTNIRKHNNSNYKLHQIYYNNLDAEYG